MPAASGHSPAPDGRFRHYVSGNRKRVDRENESSHFVFPIQETTGKGAFRSAVLESQFVWRARLLDVIHDSLRRMTFAALFIWSGLVRLCFENRHSLAPTS